jgi:hypothetical protein
MAASVLSVVNPANVTGNPSVAGYLAHDGGPGRIYTTAAAIAAGGASAACPVLTLISQVTAVDGAFPDPEQVQGTAQGGPYVMKLTPAAGDTVNISSPMSRIYLSPNAFIITITG